MPERNDYALAFDRFDGRYQIAIASENSSMCDFPLAGQEGHIDANHAVNPFLLENRFSVSVHSAMHQAPKAHLKSRQKG